jgi:PAS domain S-box-containing protein
MKAVAREERRVAYSLALLFAILAAAIVAAGCRYYRHYEQQFRTEAWNQLSAVAELKVDELAQYRKERLWDADDLFKNTAFSGLVRRFFDHPEDTDAQQQLQQWTDQYLATRQYDHVRLFDAQGVSRLSVPAGRPPISSDVSQRVPEVLRSGQVTWHDFHRNEHDQRIYLTLLVPILDETDPRHALGVLALRIDPEIYLYPFIKRWPTPSQTAETLLVRRDGNDALFLNDLKFGTNTALNLRIPLTNTNVPAVKAILGEKGIVEGVDYRGEPVLASLHAVPDSPWFLEARIDTAEVYAPLRERLRLTLLLVSLLLISAGAGIGAIWRQQRSRFYKERYEMAEVLRESEERFGRVFEEGPTGMAMLDEHFRFIQANPTFASMLGYSVAELRTKTFAEVTHPDHVQQDVEQVRHLLRGELSVYRTEKRYIAKSGKVLWGQLQVSVLRNADGAFHYFLAIIGDITERKRAEEELRRVNRALRTVSDCNQAMVRAPDEVTLLTDICRLLIERGGYRMAWVGFAEHDEARSVHPVAQAGFDEGYLDIVQVTWADIPRGRGPVGTAIRTKQPVVVRNVLTDPSFEPWRQGAIQRSYAAVTALPLMRDDHVYGALTVYAAEPDVFDAGEMELLTELAGDVAYGITSLRSSAERKRAEESLQNSQVLYRSLVEHLPQSIFRKDRAGRFQFVNERFCRDLRRSFENIVGRTDADFFPPELAQTYRRDDLRIMETGQALDQEEKHVGADGQESFVHVIKTPLRDAHGQIIGIQGIFWDVTARKQAEISLLHEQTLMATLMENVPDAIYFKDAASRFLRANHALARKLGLSDPAQLIGKSDADYFSREHARRSLADEQEIVRTGQPLLNIEEKETWLDGTVGWVLTTKLPLRDTAGHLIGTCGISRDITERKRAEEALRESQALYHSLVEQLSVGVFRKDRPGRYVLVNPEFCRLKGMKAEDFLGKTPREVAAVAAAKQGATGRPPSMPMPAWNSMNRSCKPANPLSWLKSMRKPMAGSSSCAS